jgi:ribosomal protein S6E (S10)
MPFKLNISQKGKAWKLELDSEILVGKKITDKIPGKEISPELDGYELELTGATDFAGFPHSPNLEGPDKRRVLLTKGFGMHKKPKKEGKKKTSTPKGLRLRKSIRGSQISDKTIQINFNVLKEGSKKLAEIFPEQNATPQASPSQSHGMRSVEQESSVSKDSPELEKKESPSPDSKPTPQPTTDQVTDNKPTDSSSPPQDKVKEKIEEEVKEEIAEEIKEDIPTSPETKTSEEKEEAAEKVAEEVVEESKEAIDKSSEKKNE